MKEQIKQSLELASTQHEWDTDGRTVTWKDGHPLKGTYRTIAITHAPVSESFRNENHENDAHLIANAPEWLRWQNERIEQLEERIEAENEALKITCLERNELRDRVEQLEKSLECHSCGGSGYVELSHDPYMTTTCECVVFEQVLKDYPKLKQRNMKLEKALKEISEFDVGAVYGYRDEWTESYGFTSCQVIASQALGKEE